MVAMMDRIMVESKVVRMVLLLVDEWVLCLVSLKAAWLELRPSMGFPPKSHGRSRQIFFNSLEKSLYEILPEWVLVSSS